MKISNKSSRPSIAEHKLLSVGNIPRRFIEEDLINIKSDRLNRIGSIKIIGEVKERVY